MKFRNLILTTSILISVVTFAQKEELKSAEKSLRGGHSYEAQRTLEEAEYLITNADDATKAQFYFLKGNALYDQSKKNVDTDKNLLEAAKSYNELVAIESTSDKPKYTVLAQASLKEIREVLFNGALADDKDKKFKESALKLYQVYQLERRDSIMLYYAAGSALNSRDLDLALEYYTKLKEINYSGKGTTYTAKNKATNQEETFNSIAEREMSIKLGTHSTPKTETVPSKRGEIYKHITEILIEKGDIKGAKKAIVNARYQNPDDTSLILTEANLYLKTNEFDMYKKLVTELLIKKPNDADLYYNLGVISSKTIPGKIEAEKYYQKAIDLNPKYKEAYLNLAILKLDGDKELVDQMSKLGMSAEDTKKYDALKLKQKNMYKSALTYLEKAHELFVNDPEVKATLLGIYGALDMDDKYKALKASK
ncbi:hypothetical protein [Flavobacterium sp.]|uniref:hypothetical protein n=1 Tax=Flavobacterium sp. TaxID=239 RepID=UPI00286E8C78|nr:hypothetical protein [Flavobacterium sp.]